MALLAIAEDAARAAGACCSSASAGRGARCARRARRPTSCQRGRHRSGTGAARLPRRPPARRRRAGGGGWRSRRRHERRALDRRPARRDHELPLRDPPMGRQRGLRGRRRTRSPGSSSTRCAARSSPPPATARPRETASGWTRRAAATWRPRWWGPGSLRRRGQGGAGRGRGPRAAPRARPAPDGQRRARPGVDRVRALRRLLRARTAAAGTAPRANCCAPGRDSSCAGSVRTARFPPGSSSPRRRSPVGSASSSGRKEHVFRPTRRMFPLAWRLGAVPSSYSPGRGRLRK